MTVRLIKRIYCIIIISLVKITTISAHTISDTTKLIAGTTKKMVTGDNSATTIANVEYPENLQDGKEQSLGYVENFSNKKRSYLINIYEKGKEFFPKVEEILKRFQLPVELKVLIALESGFNGNAISRAGAVGYWQMMDAAAKEYGLHIVTGKRKQTGKLKKKDDRKNFSKSTLAAAKYLRDRCLDLNNDLLLMVASYNCGTGRVWRAIKKCGKDDAGFWDIKTYLPAETRNYVMNFIALNVIFENYENFANKQLVFYPALIENTKENDAIYNTLPPGSENLD
ncbi:MAG: lytic transglycosylase domain-containing protein [Ginsengibacter sp.]